MTPEERARAVAGHQGSCDHVPHPGTGAACRRCVEGALLAALAAQASDLSALYDEHRDAAIAEEREACAKVVDQFALGAQLAADDPGCPEGERREHRKHLWLAADIAAAIRARRP